MYYLTLTQCVSFDAYKTSTIFRIKIRICVIPYHIKSRLWLNDDKVFNELSELTIKCKCGKSITFVYDQKYKICSECGRKVYFSKNSMFMPHPNLCSFCETHNF